MTRTETRPTPHFAAFALIGLLAAPAIAVPQDSAPSAPAGTGDLVLEGGLGQAPPTQGRTRRRRPADDSPVVLGFKKEKLESVVPFIVEWTGKAVMMRLTQVSSIEITLVNDEPISKDRALDLLFQAFRMNGIGVVETDDVIMIEMLTDMEKIQPAVILGPDVDVMEFPEDGNIVIKVFRLRNTKAAEVFDRLQASIPTYATLTVDAASNQLILEGDIGLPKRIHQLISLLDVEPSVETQTPTLRLPSAHAHNITAHIPHPFHPSASTSSLLAPTRHHTAQPDRP